MVQLSEHWHHLSAQEVVDLLGTQPEHGLGAEMAEDRLHAHGPNRLTPPRKTSSLKRFLLQFHVPLVYLLLIAGITTLLVGHLLDASVILGVVLINAIVGFWQEHRAVATIEALATSLVSEAVVLRGGHRQRIASERLVPGDLVILSSGDRVPADIRLLNGFELQINESALTGESVPASKRPGQLPPETSIGDRHNMAFASTLVTHGSAAGLVVDTGDDTEIGEINRLLQTTESLETPLLRRLSHFSNVLLYIIVLLAVATFAIGLWHGMSWLDTFLATVALAVAAIPEGLPAALTITLAIGVKAMARRQAIVRKLPVVEALGSTTVICTDKTGTITRNQMTVRRIVTPAGHYRVSGEGLAPTGMLKYENDQPVGIHDDQALQLTLRTGLLCVDAQVFEQAGQWRLEGDPTEGALIVAALKAGLDEAIELQNHPKLAAIPFESQNQYMATLHGEDETRRRVLWKGSFEALLPRCTGQMNAQGEVEPFDADTILATLAQLADQGMRVLAFATTALAGEERNTLDHDQLQTGLIFTGLMAMIDPPRTEAAEAVSECHRAGITVKMITGDHARTALAVAREVGIATDVDQAVTGLEIARCSDSELIQLVGRTQVFARVAPEQKLRLVKALQESGEVVAMTGDGVNDAPALKRADIGVAMGRNGSEVAREAGDMVLADDNFASIAAAVEEGRTVYDNLVKFIAWTLPTNVGEGLVVLISLSLGMSLPMTPVQILYINMATALLLGLMLAFEPKEHDLMRRPPRAPGESIINRNQFERILWVGLLLVGSTILIYQWHLDWGHDQAMARTMAVNLFVFGEMAYLLSCRSLTHSPWQIGLLSNRPLLLGMLAMTALQLLITYWPPANELFGTRPMPLVAWGWILLLASGIFISIELAKGWQRHRRRQSARPSSTR